MLWKNWPHWLKGGALFSGIISICFIGFVILLVFLGLTQGSFDPAFNLKLQINFIFANLIALIIYFLPLAFFIGAIIGLIYGKIKNKKVI